MFVVMDDSFTSNVEQMENVKCAWSNLFDQYEKDSLEGGLFLTGLVSVLLGLCLSLGILLSQLSTDASYRNLGYYYAASCIRRIVPLLAHLSLFKVFDRSDELDPITCRFFGFVETFLAVYEIEWLTHICIERYVVAKYITNGWFIQKYHYTLFQYLCFFFATVYSLPPLFGFGQYSYDFSCSFCTFDMILPESWDRYVVVIIFALRSIKPTIMMLIMLIWARILENKFKYSEENQKQTKLTKNVIKISIVSQICWLPIALIRGGVILSQLMYAYPIVAASAFYIKLAMWIHWSAPALTASTMFLFDHRIRNNILHTCSPDHDDGKDDDDFKKDK